MGVELIGVEDLNKFLQNIKITNKKELASLLGAMALETHKESVTSIQSGGRSGRFYRRGHQASSPGEPPKTDTGQLVRNITMQKVGELEYTVGSRKGAPYGFWLEFGTRKMGARPWLKPAFDRMLNKFRGLFRG